MRKYITLSELFKITKNLNKSMKKLNIDTEFYLKIAENEDYLQKCCLFDKMINKNEIDDKFPKNERVDVVVRPEDAIIVEADQGMVKGKIVSRVFKGIYYEYVG